MATLIESHMTTTADYKLLDIMARPAMLISDGRIVHANPAAHQLLGAHISGQDVRLALRQPDVVDLILGKKPGATKITGLSTRGSLWDVTCHHLDDGKRLVTLEDMSVQVSIARAHADFVANASHELRTPLASVLGYVETLKDPKAGDDPETRNRFLDIIKHEAARMQALVDDLMSLSRVEALKHEVPTEKIDVVALCREVAGEFFGKAAVVAADDHAEILGDKSQMAQVIRNLIDNAIKYGALDDVVMVRLETTATGWVTIEVVDKGEGIAPEHLPRLTERFYRVDAGRSRKVGGTGLGLSIVKHSVERHRGRFDLRSRPGEGTTAAIMLPLAAANRPS
jgi:two-component system, OmpR family, phosphate regulon sensor histidine kinase PhoR